MAEFVIGDYAYITISDGGVMANVVNNMKTSYENIPSSVTYDGVTYPVTSLDQCFSGCNYLVTPPSIPSGVKSMQSCFYLCRVMTTAPTIPSTVTNLRACFAGCTSLVTPPTIPSGVTDMFWCFDGCSSLESAPVMPASVKNTVFTFRSCTSLGGKFTTACTPDLSGQTRDGVDFAKLLFYGTVEDILIELQGSADPSFWRDVANTQGNLYALFDHTPPSLSFTVTRCDSSGADDDLGTYARVQVSAQAVDSNVPPQSASIASLHLEVDGATVTPTWTDDVAIVSLGDYGIHAFAMTATDNYGFTCEPITVSIPSANPALDFTHDDATGLNGVSVGKPATVAGLLDVGMDMNVDGDIKNNGTRVMPVFAVASWSTSSDESTLPATPCIVLSLSNMGLYHCTG